MNEQWIKQWIIESNNEKLNEMKHQKVVKKRQKDVKKHQKASKRRQKQGGSKCTRLPYT